MSTPELRFVSGANYGSFFKYVDSAPPAGSKFAIFTIAPANLDYFIDVAAAGLVLQDSSDVVVSQSNSKGGTTQVRRYPGDDEPFNRANVARTIMKNRDVRHGAALPGRRFILEEVTGDGSEGQRRQFTYQGTTTELHAKLVAFLKVDVRFINANGAWESISAPANSGE